LFFWNWQLERSVGDGQCRKRRERDRDECTEKQRAVVIVGCELGRMWGRRRPV
jgi:hypothetical protein